MKTRRRAGWRYSVRFLAGMAIYTAGFLIAMRVPRQTAPLSYVLALVPAIGVAISVWAMYRFVLETDEYQRLRTLTQLAASLGITLVLSFTYGMCETVAGAPHAGLLWVPALFGASYAVVAIVAGLRERR